MPVTHWDRSFFGSTRGRIVTLLRRGTLTVEELATTLGITPNAVRGHLASLEGDGYVRRAEARRGLGKPAFAYELTPGVDQLLSQAYVPLLTHLLQHLADQTPMAQLQLLMREVGRKMAASQPAAHGNLRARVNVAATLLGQLGGLVDILDEGGTLVLTAASCPLSAAVSECPAVCGAVQALLEEVTGLSVEERCARGSRPRCSFAVTAPA